MSPELARRVVDSLDKGLSGFEVICIHLYGGEPLCNLPALEAMISRAEEKRGRFRFAITTNGYSSSAEAISLLDRGRFQVVLSIDGPAEIHDSCRVTATGRPSHAAVLRFLDRLRSGTRCWVRGSSVVRSGWSLREASAYLATLPVNVVKAQAVRLPPGRPYALSDSEKIDYLRDLEEVGRQVVEDLEKGRPPRDDRFSSRVLQLLKGTKRKHFCGAGASNFGVAPDGTVLPCVLMDAGEHRLGDVFGDPETWVRSGRKWRANSRPKKNCGGCTVSGLCGGGCPALMPLCGDGECEIIRKNCEVAMTIYRHFIDRKEALLALAGIV